LEGVLATILPLYIGRGSPLEIREAGFSRLAIVELIFFSSSGMENDRYLAVVLEVCLDSRLFASILLIFCPRNSFCLIFSLLRMEIWTPSLFPELFHQFVTRIA
jgi:hypothetical protein